MHANSRDGSGRSHPLLHRRTLLGLALLSAVIGWALYAAMLGLDGRAHLSQAEQRVPSIQEAVAGADVDLATELLAVTQADLSAAASLLGHPLLAPVRALPVIGVDVRIARTIADGGAQLASEALLLVGELQGDGGLGALTPQAGALPIAPLQRLASVLDDTAATLDTLVDDLEGLQPSGHIDDVSRAHAEVLELLSPLVTRTAEAATLTSEFARFLGADGQQTYLLGASTPSELRGTGGYIGSIATLRIDAGELSVGTFTASSDVPRLPDTAVPPPVPEDAHRWQRYGGTGFLVNLNFTPDFPSAAEAILSHLRESLDETYDGMIVVDPFALEVLLALSGPASVPDFDTELTSDNVVDFVLNEAYSRFDDPDERKAVLGAVAAATLQRFLDGAAAEVSPRAAFDGLVDLARGGHVLLYSREDTTQAAFAAAGLDGALGLGPEDEARDYLAVVINNGGANKLDYYAQRRLRMETTLLDDGSARSELVLDVENHAPTEGQPSYVIGPNSPGLEAGEARSGLRVYLAPNARFEEVPPATDLPGWTEREQDHPVDERWVRIPAGDSVQHRYRWRTKDAWWSNADGRIHYELVLDGQPVVRPTEVVVAIRMPQDTTVASDLPDGGAVEDDRLVWRGTIRGDRVRIPMTIERAHDTGDAP